MSKRSLLVLLSLLILLLPGMSLMAEEDEHFIQTDDFFIAAEAYKNQDWIYVYLAKMTKAPSKETKSEGQFMQAGDGKSVWTKYFWLTRQAVPADLNLGAIVVMADLTGDGDIYRAPETKDEARSASWFLAKITDTSDLYKDYVTVSGGYKINVKALRVPVPVGK